MPLTSEARDLFRNRPFPLYGLATPKPAAFLYGAEGGVLRHAKLDHGVRDSPDQSWVEVTVAEPLHGTDPGGRQWGEDYSTLALFHVVVANDPSIDGRQIPDAEASLAAHWSPAQLIVNGQPETFQFVREGQHWGAIRHLEPDHAIVVCASNVEPDTIRLSEVEDIQPYLQED